MATKLSDLDDQKSLVNIETEGHTLTQPSGQNGPEETETFGSTPPIHLPSLWQGNQHLITLWFGIVWKYKWFLPKMGEQHHYPLMPGRHQ